MVARNDDEILAFRMLSNKPEDVAFGKSISDEGIADFLSRKNEPLNLPSRERTIALVDELPDGPTFSPIDGDEAGFEGTMFAPDEEDISLRPILENDCIFELEEDDEGPILNSLFYDDDPVAGNNSIFDPDEENAFDLSLSDEDVFLPSSDSGITLPSRGKRKPPVIDHDYRGSLFGNIQTPLKDTPVPMMPEPDERRYEGFSLAPGISMHAPKPGESLANGLLKERPIQEDVSEATPVDEGTLQNFEEPQEVIAADDAEFDPPVQPVVQIPDNYVSKDWADQHAERCVQGVLEHYVHKDAVQEMLNKTPRTSFVKAAYQHPYQTMAKGFGFSAGVFAAIFAGVSIIQGSALMVDEIRSGQISLFNHKDVIHKIPGRMFEHVTGSFASNTRKIYNSAVEKWNSPSPDP